MKLVADAVLAACDALDGLADGIVSDYEGCLRAFDPTTLRCASGIVSATCLSEAPLRTLQTMYAPFEFPFPLANGVRSYPAWGRGGESAQGSGPVGGWLYGSGAVQYFFAREATVDPRRFNPTLSLEGRGSSAGAVSR